MRRIEKYQIKGTASQKGIKHQMTTFSAFFNVFLLLIVILHTASKFYKNFDGNQVREATGFILYFQATKQS